MMLYLDQIEQLKGNPEQLEQTYRSAVAASEETQFHEAIESVYTVEPENVLLAAWHFRLQNMASVVKHVAIPWNWIAPLAILNGLIFWQLAIQAEPSVNPPWPLLNAFAPVATLLLLIFLTAFRRDAWRLALVLAGVLCAGVIYGTTIRTSIDGIDLQEQYGVLSLAHLAVLCVLMLGRFAVAPQNDAANRFRFMIKVLETAILGGLFMIAGGVFSGLTLALFEMSGVEIELWSGFLLLFGGLGLIPLVATGITYNPRLLPAEQSFDEGMSKTIARLMRVMLILTLIVLTIYSIIIPFNFLEAFENRDILLLYNATLFGVVLVLGGGTPLSMAEMTPRVSRWLWSVTLAVTTLSFLMSLYSLSAIVFRSFDGLTPNRLTFIGWNVVNAICLGLLATRLWRTDRATWIDAVKRSFSFGMRLYVAWIIVVIFALPWLFR